MIDKHFRRALEHAEATPPADLFERIMDARTVRRRTPVWWRPSVLGLLLVGGAGAALLWSVPKGSENPAFEDGVTSPTAYIKPPSTSKLWKSEDAAALPGSIDGPMSLSTPSNALMPSPSSPIAPNLHGATASPPGTEGHDGPNTELPSNTHHSAPARPGSGVTRSANDPVLTLDQERGPLALLNIRNMAPAGPGPATLRTTAKAAPYVLPRGEWWLGPRATVLHEHLTWHGDQERLVNALNNAEPVTTNWAFGLMGGRSWRSGLRVGSGLLYERSEKALSAQDRQVVVGQEVNTYYVTLNNEVFVSQVDTIMTVTTQERTVTTSQERALLRIPVEVGWAFDLWRFQLVPKVGLAVDLHLQREGTALNFDGPDGPLTSTHPSESDLRERQPDVLLAWAGFDLAYVLNERWSLDVGPRMMWTAATLTRSTDQPQGLPQRAGMGFGLTYLLPGKRP